MFDKFSANGCNIMLNRVMSMSPIVIIMLRVTASEADRSQHKIYRHDINHAHPRATLRLFVSKRYRTGKVEAK